MAKKKKGCATCRYSVTMRPTTGTRCASCFYSGKCWNYGISNWRRIKGSKWHSVKEQPDEEKWLSITVQQKDKSRVVYPGWYRNGFYCDPCGTGVRGEIISWRYLPKADQAVYT